MYIWKMVSFFWEFQVLVDWVKAAWFFGGTIVLAFPLRLRFGWSFVMFWFIFLMTYSDVFLGLGHFFLFSGLVVILIDGLSKPVCSLIGLCVDLINITLPEIHPRRPPSDSFLMPLLLFMFLLQQGSKLLLECLHFLVDIILHFGLYFSELVAGGLIYRYVLCAVAIDQGWRYFSSKFR